MVDVVYAAAANLIREQSCCECGSPSRPDLPSAQSHHQHQAPAPGSVHVTSTRQNVWQRARHHHHHHHHQQIVWQQHVGRKPCSDSLQELSTDLCSSGAHCWSARAVAARHHRHLRITRSQALLQSAQQQQCMLPNCIGFEIAAVCFECSMVLQQCDLRFQIDAPMQLDAQFSLVRLWSRSSNQANAAVP